tara:strand:- start:259 stop:1218 length:960 start_codon:yes stop_codon:yes gene_type:complete
MSRTNDNVYYNIRINSETSQGRAFYDENRVAPILNNPSEYELAIERFRIPATDIPIFIWKGDDYFKVTMSYNGIDVTEPLVFIPNISVPDTYGDAIWNYQELIDILNVALSNAYTAINIASPGSSPTEAPFLTYDADTQLLTFNAEQLYDTNGVPTIDIYFNSPLYLLVPSFQTFSNSQIPLKEYQIIVKNNLNNITTIGGKAYYSTKQEYNTLSLWNDLVSIAFETDSVPVSAEKQGDQKNVVKRIMTDFEPLEDINNRQAFQFYPQGPLRFYDMNSIYPLSRIDLKVYWVDKNDKSYPIFINENEVLTVKILFRKKY